jgi:hypothetical protein
MDSILINNPIALIQKKAFDRTRLRGTALKKQSRMSNDLQAVMDLSSARPSERGTVYGEFEGHALPDFGPLFK